MPQIMDTLLVSPARLTRGIVPLAPLGVLAVPQAHRFNEQEAR